MKKNIVLATGSPRRHEIMKMAGYTFTVRKADIDESYPGDLDNDEIAVYLANKKADHFEQSVGDDLYITFDTIVILNNRVLGKPTGRLEAENFLQELSGNTHEVISGVCLMTRDQRLSLHDSTLVSFRDLTKAEIGYYLDHFAPYDKAGAYGIQEWIGLIGIRGITGSFYNVMGLPIHKVYQALEEIKRE